MNKIYVVGIGPGGCDQMTGIAMEALKASDVIIGYTAVSYAHLITTTGLRLVQEIPLLFLQTGQLKVLTVHTLIRSMINYMNS